MRVGQDIYMIEIFSTGKGAQFPIIMGNITVKWDRNYSAGTLQFKVVKDSYVSYNEGDTVIFSINGQTYFKGYVFSKKRDKNQVIDTLCYDSLRYLVVNSDTYQYGKMSMSSLLKKICADRLLEVGDIEETGYKIPKKIEKNKSYMSMIKYADEVTLSQTGNILTLFDDKGKVCLKSANSMFVDYPITYDNAVDFDYQTSIDDGTYNRVVVYLVDDDKRVLKKVVKQNASSIKRWGVLEYTVTTNNDEDIDKKASQLLEIFNRVYRSLTIKNVTGNASVRAGSLVPVRFMAIGDINISSLMIVDSVEHRFEDGYHFMDLKVFNKDVMPVGKGDGMIQSL